MTTAIEVLECRGMLHYFNEVSPHLWSVAQQRAVVAGHMTPSLCHTWITVYSFDRLGGDPTSGGCTQPVLNAVNLPYIGPVPLPGRSEPEWVYESRDESEGRPVHDLWTTRLRPLATAGRVRAAPRRQRRRSVPIAGARVGTDPPRAIRGPQREDRRARHRSWLHGGATADRPGGTEITYKKGACRTVRRWPDKADHRHPRPQQQRDPRRLLQLHVARASPEGERLAR